MSQRIHNSMARLLTLAALATLQGCGATFTKPGPPATHFSDWKVTEPRRNTVEVCSSYGCRTRQRFTFTSGDVATLRSILSSPEPASSAHEERRRIGRAIAWIERRVGPATGTHTDRPLLDFPR